MSMGLKNQVKIPLIFEVINEHTSVKPMFTQISIK
jgi:hypothetical protein